MALVHLIEQGMDTRKQHRNSFLTTLQAFRSMIMLEQVEFSTLAHECCNPDNFKAIKR